MTFGKTSYRRGPDYERIPAEPIPLWVAGFVTRYDPFADVCCDRPQSGDEVREEVRGVVVPFVKRQPGGRSRLGGDPFAEQRGLAESGEGTDEGQLPVSTLVEALDQAGAGEDSWLGRGNKEFGDQNRSGHRSSS
jgi:hypothetical protein